MHLLMDIDLNWIIIPDKVMVLNLGKHINNSDNYYGFWIVNISAKRYIKQYVCKILINTNQDSHFMWFNAFGSKNLIISKLLTWFCNDN